MNSDRSGSNLIRLRTGLAALAFCLLLCSYYIIRPVRDDVGVALGQGSLKWLFSATFFCTLAVVPLFGWLAQKCPRWLLTPLVYLMVILVLIGFGVAFQGGPPQSVAIAFFIWLSFFNLLVVSLFWSTISDTFSTAQAKIYYGYIAAGGTAGAVIGPAITAQIATRVSTSTLLFVSAGVLSLAMASLILIRVCSQPVDRGEDASRPIGGSVFAGITHTFRTPILRNLAGLVICYTAISTAVYVEMNGLVGTVYPDPGERREFFAKIDLGINLLALVLQLLVTNVMIQKLGLNRTLLVAPLATLLFTILFELDPRIQLMSALQIALRAIEFSLAKPCREIFYTTVDAESRYKAKNFIDTAVSRANDSASAWGVEAIRKSGLSPMLVLLLPMIALWVWLALRIGKKGSSQASVGTQKPV